MSILQDLQTAKEQFNNNALNLITDAISDDNIDRVLNQLDELISIISTGRGIGIICRDKDNQISNRITQRLNEGIDVLTGAARPVSNTRKKAIIEHVGTVEHDVVPVLTMKQKVRQEWESNARKQFETVTTTNGYVARKGHSRGRKVSACNYTLPIGWRGQAVPKERYNAKTVLESMKRLGADSLIITYEHTTAANRIDIALWRLTAKETLKHITTPTGDYVGQLVKVVGNMVHLRPLWVNTTEQVTLSSVVLQLELSGEITNIVL